MQPIPSHPCSHLQVVSEVVVHFLSTILFVGHEAEQDVQGSLPVVDHDFPSIHFLGDLLRTIPATIPPISSAETEMAIIILTRSLLSIFI